ncbi:MAG TPA: methyltransferase domain-containing protein [Chitinophagaceae bacterium]|nr:methyltransferase domain-containing protein [Chitinophagaceae bacterium]
MLRNFIQRLFYKPLPFPGEYFLSDKKFNKLYPPYIQQLARKHWTPLEVCKLAAEFLVTGDGVKILDIGSGAGKFCIAAAYYQPNAIYYGVEQRQNLALHAEDVKNRLGFTNAAFIHGNFTALDFTEYNHFYFYNSFYEHIIDDGHIDENIPFSKETYRQYNEQLFALLEKMPAGTRLVTYHVTRAEIPSYFKITREEVDGFLKFCVKV